LLGFALALVFAWLALRLRHWRNARLVRLGLFPYRDCAFHWTVVRGSAAMSGLAAAGFSLAMHWPSASSAGAGASVVIGLLTLVVIVHQAFRTATT
jgi:hypothetical protein